jgi:hypothetical protein
VELYLVRAQEIMFTNDSDEETIVTVFEKEYVKPERVTLKAQTYYGVDVNLVYAGEAIFKNYKGTPEITVSNNGIKVPYDPSNVMHSKKPLVVNSNGNNIIIGTSRPNLMNDQNKIVYLNRDILPYSTPYIYRKI